MSKALDQFHEDRAIRDATKAVLLADIEHARGSFSAKGVADRVGGRIGDGAKDVYEVAKTQPDSTIGIVAALIGAILVWLGRDTILEVLGLEEVEEASDDEAETPQPALDTPPSGDNDEQ